MTRGEEPGTLYDLHQRTALSDDELTSAKARRNSAATAPAVDRWTGTFSLHAALCVQVHERERLEQRGRYVTRPALSDERVQLNAAGRVELKLKTA